MNGPPLILYQSRLVLAGSLFVIELHHDGTGTIRARSNNAPLCSVTSGNARLIESFHTSYVDRLAAEARKHPPVWGDLRRPPLPALS